MKITLITVGKIKEKYLRDAIGEYSKRLSKYCKLEIIEVPEDIETSCSVDIPPNITPIFFINFSSLSNK